MPKKKIEYEVNLTKEAIEKPRLYQLPSKTWVGVGGPIKRTPKLPQKPYTIKEATKAQYLLIFQDGKNKHLGNVEFIQSKKSNSKVDS